MNEHSQKSVTIYHHETVVDMQVGKDGVKDIHFNGRAVRIDFDNGDHRWISGFPFDFTSPNPQPLTDKQLLES